MKKPLTFTVTAITLTLGALSFGTGCASEVPEEPAADSSEDALSAGECKAVVGKNMADYKKRCDGYAALASSAPQQAAAAFAGVAPALTKLEATLSRESAAFGTYMNQCKAQATCNTTVFRESLQAAGYDANAKPLSCSVTEAVTTAICFVDVLLPLIGHASSAAVQQEISSELATLKSSLKFAEFGKALLSGKVNEAKHSVCSNKDIQTAESTRLTAICRSDCGDGNHTLGNAGINRACAPAGFPADVKCGVMKRSGLSCECVEGGILGFGNKCRDYEILASQLGTACPTNAAQKIADVKWVNDAPAYTCK